MADLLGIPGVQTPSFNITGAIGGSWVYIVFIVAFIIIAVMTIFLVMFFRTHNKRVVIFQNISGLGFQPIKKMRARTVSLGTGGYEILKCMGGEYVSAYGRPMGKNSFWFAKLEDGLLYNFVMTDLDVKKATMDVRPTTLDSRGFYVTRDKLTDKTYNKKSFAEKYGIQVMIIILIIIVLIGLWAISSKTTDGMKALAANDQARIEADNRLADAILLMNQNLPKSSGIVPANLGG